MQNNSKTNKIQEPGLCQKCTSFYANPQFGSFCSKCYKESSTSQTEIQKPKVPELPKISKIEKLETPKEVPIKQINFSNCWSCEKKIGIRGFKCKCKYSFCKKHRLPEDHVCKYDFQEEGKKKLKESNKIIQNGKIERI